MSADVNNDVELGLGIELNDHVNGQGPTRLGPGAAGRQRSGTLPSVRSVQRRASQVASISRQIIKRVTQRPVQPPVTPLSQSDLEAREEFFCLILGRQNGASPPPSEPLSPPCEWYANFLECRFRGAWTMLMRPALMGLRETSNDPLPGEISTGYRFMIEAAKALLEDDGLALVDIVDRLGNMHLLREEAEDLDRALANQLVFASIGWLTMLFDPEPRQTPGTLQIRRSRESFLHRHTLLRSRRTFINYTLKGFDDIDQPLHIFLRRFGSLIPEIKTDLPGESELIAVSCVCFSMLDKVAGVKIEWVNSLSLHLEFDNVRRILKVFRFPSYCKMMYLESTLISRLYLDNCHFLRERGLEDQEEDRCQEFFREVLLSYRLIFGQDKASWKAFNKKFPKWEDHWDCSDNQSDDRDPMLRTLCGSSWKSRVSHPFYREIDAEDTSPFYYPDSEFPFLGRRILNLQTFVRGLHPYSFTALWHDRRNVAFWWTFWVVLFIGGGTILLAILSFAFQVWSSISGQQQVNISSDLPNAPA